MSPHIPTSVHAETLIIEVDCLTFVKHVCSPVSELFLWRYGVPNNVFELTNIVLMSADIVSTIMIFFDTGCFNNHLTSWEESR